MIKWIRYKLALRKFNKMCPHVRCSCCNNSCYDNDDNHVCELARQLGLE
jgi:hypothetical protein